MFDCRRFMYSMNLFWFWGCDGGTPAVGVVVVGVLLVLVVVALLLAAVESA